MVRPLCFVLMPFGKKNSSDGREIDFDAVYHTLIEPAIVAAGMESLRADAELVGGVIHKAMFERLILCEYAVADLTTANANVFYELGVRHAVRPWATQLLFAEAWGQLPFDVKTLRALPYQLAANGTPSNAVDDIGALTERLNAARHATTDSPIFQMVEGFPDIQHLKTDVFRDRVRYAENIKEKLAIARKDGVNAVNAIESTIGDISKVETAVVVDLFLSYRAVKAWDKMVEMIPKMVAPLSATVMIREQEALALNRLGRRREAEQKLLKLIEDRGESSETYGILGRVYKDLWEDAKNAQKYVLADGFLTKAIETYVKGFEIDWRDAYPGVNAVTLMALQSQSDPRQAILLPVVAYSVSRRIAQGQPDYWDYATKLEIEIIRRDAAAARLALADALAHFRQAWELETTCRNIGLLREFRAAQGEDVTWIEKIEAELVAT